MRADRLLSIIFLLQKHHHLKAKQLSEQLGVTERTIYRDVEALSLAGVPIYTQTGKDGGIFLDEYYRTEMAWFTGAGLQTLMATGTASPLSDLGMQSAVDNALVKLLSLLPYRRQQEAQVMAQRLYLDPTGWYGITEAHPALSVIKEAVWRDAVIEVAYENWQGDKQARQLAPYSLVYKSDRWYLVARPYPDGTMRTYRVSRINDVKITSTHFDRDLNFDIADYWEQASEAFLQRIPIYPVILRVHPDTMTYFNHMMAGRYEILVDDGGWLTLRVTYTVFEEARTSVLGLATHVEVLEPTELHDTVIAMAQAIVAKHCHDEGE